MQRRRDVPAELMNLAAAQAGALSRRQVLGAGVSARVIERLISTDRWRRLVGGIYLTAPVEPSWEALAWSGILLGGHRSRLGPRASGHLHRLIPDPPCPVDVLIPNERVVRLTDAGSWRFIRERPGARSPRNVGSPPRLAVEATVLDLCGAATEKEVIGIITTAVERRLTSAKRLAAAMAGRSRQRHRQLISDLIADVALGAESPLEVSYLRKVERPHGLPRGIRQQQRSGLRYRSDVGYDEYGLLVELDGRAGHEGMGRFRDMNRDNRLAVARWMTLRYGWFDVVERPCAVAMQVAEVLTTRGWPGSLNRCHNCVNWHP